MSKMTLSTQSLLELLTLFDQSNNTVQDSEGNRLHGVAGWWIQSKTDLAPTTLQTWTTRVGYAGVIDVPCADDRVFVDINETDDPSKYEYRCPETFCRKFVSADLVAVLDVNSTKLLNFLADLLNIGQVKRDGIQTPRIERKLWRLGEARIGPVMTPIWLARGLDVSVKETFDSLLDTRLPAQGLILCPGPPLPRIIRPPRNYRIAYLRDALVNYSPMPCMDVHYLERILTSHEDGIVPSALPVEFANGVLSIRTKNDTWTISGEKQHKAVEYMYAQAQLGRWELDASEILAAAYPERRTEESRKGLKMQSLFSGNEKWREFIDNPVKGKYTFKLS